MRSLRILPVLGAAALALAACSGGAPTPEATASSDDSQVPDREIVLNVYAAASLTETFSEAKPTSRPPTPRSTSASTTRAPRTWSPSSAREPTSTSWPPPTNPP